MVQMRGQALRLRPVNSIKHVIDAASSAVLATISSVPLAKAVDNPVLSTVTEITGGSIINAIYLRVEVMSTAVSTGVPRLYMTVQKDPGGNLAVVAPNAVGNSDNKKFVIHQEMIMVSDNALADFPRTMFRGVIKIPQRYRRFGVRDELAVHFQNAPGEASSVVRFCVQCIYKEYR